MTNVEDAWKALSHTHELIKVADTKAGMVIAASGLLGGRVVHVIPPHAQWSAHPVKIGLLLLGVALVCSSVVLALLVFVPRLRSGMAPSLLYFGDIVRFYPRRADFAGPYVAMLEREQWLQESLADQFWVTSHIARRKFRRITPAIWLLGAALLLSLGAGLLP